MKIFGKHRPCSHLAFLSILCVILFAGCGQKENRTLSALLETVPADAGGAVVVNIETLLRESGCKISDDGIRLSDQVRKFVSEARNAQDSLIFGLLVEGKGGVDLSSVVLFSSTRMYLTGLLKDQAKFKEYVESLTATRFEGDDEAAVNGEYAYVGNQFWICTGRPELSDLERYRRLSQNQSIVSRKGIEKLSEADGVVAGLVDLQTMFRTGGVQRSPIPMAMATIFDSPSQFWFDGNVAKKRLCVNANIMNNDGKPSKFLLPTSKVDVSVIAKMEGGAESLWAIAISADLMKKVASMLGRFGGSLLGQDSPLLQIDGTCVFAQGRDGNKTSLVSTKGNPAPALVSMAGELTGMQTTIDGDLLWLDKDKKLSGPVGISSGADRFKGVMAGGIINLNNGNESDGVKPSLIEIMLRPENGSLTIEISTELDSEGLGGFLSKVL